MNSKLVKKIGILDGMGAFAGARFFQMTLEKITQGGLPIPEIILNAVAVDDFISDPSKLKLAQRILSSRVRQLNRQKTSLVVMACNTAHLIHPSLRQISLCEFPSIIDLVVQKAVALGLKKVGILASPMTIKTKLYENALFQSGLKPFIPDNNFQKLLEKIIRAVISNSVDAKDLKNLKLKADVFIALHGLDGLILGCTELPLAFPASKFTNIKILDSLDILADAVVEHIKN